MADRPEAPHSTRRKPGGSARESRFARHVRNARAVWSNPRAAVPLVRGALLRIWRARGGGFYGLGYLVTFLVLEVLLVLGEFRDSENVLDFVGAQLFEYVLRMGLLSFLNALQAFIWPVLVLDAAGGWGLVAIPAGFLVFERWLRPRVEAAFPELLADDDGL